MINNRYIFMAWVKNQCTMNESFKLMNILFMEVCMFDVYHIL